MMISQQTEERERERENNKNCTQNMKQESSGIVLQVFSRGAKGTSKYFWYAKDGAMRWIGVAGTHECFKI